MTTPSVDLVVETGLDPEHQAREYEWAKRISDCLEKHFPGYLWAVNVNLWGKMATVQALRLSGEWGFYLKLDEVMHDPTLKCVRDAGGEILERYRVHRGAVDIDQIAALNRDRFRDFVVDAT